MSQHKVILLLGSNLGDTKININTALMLVTERIGSIKKKSKIIQTLPVEFVSKNIFRNIAIELYTTSSPITLLNAIKSIENEMGRVADTSVIGEYIDRVIDIDIVKYDDLQFCSKNLVIPHKKHLLEREFSKNLLKTLL